MPTQSLVERNDGSILFHLAVGDSMALDVLGTDEELENCRAFLRGSAAHLDHVRMGAFGSCEVLLARGADDWSVRISMRTTAVGHAAGQDISISLNRADVLKALGVSASMQIAPPPPPRVPTRPSAAPTAEADYLPDRRVLHTAADIGALIRHLVGHWTTPRMICSIDAFTELDRQRAQNRLTHLAESRAYQVLGAVAGGAALMAGAAVIVSRPFNMKASGLPWTVQQTLEHVATMLVAAGCAWLMGMLLGALWSRMRLLVALYGMRRRARVLEQAS